MHKKRHIRVALHAISGIGCLTENVANAPSFGSADRRYLQSMLKPAYKALGDVASCTGLRLNTRLGLSRCEHVSALVSIYSNASDWSATQ